MIFNETSRDSQSFARTGLLTLNGVVVPTPVFMPVGTRATIKAISPFDIEELGYELILTNTYHLYLKPGTDILDSFGGVKNFMSYKKAMLTDSGGYQVFSLSQLFKFAEDGVSFQSHIDGSRHKFTPQKVVDIQRSIGSDIMMVLDDCPAYGSDSKRIQLSLDRTHRWAKQALEHWSKDTNDQYLFGIVQGGTFKESRLKSLEAIQDLPFSGIAQGGLSVGEPREEYYRILSDIAPHQDPQRPRYMMGVGTVLDILEGVRFGIDMFDCVLPTRNARNAQVFTSRGKLNLRNQKHNQSNGPIDPECRCKVCSRISLGYLRHLHTTGELLAFHLSTYHNLAFMKSFMDSLQNAISGGEFTDFYSHWKNLYDSSN